jgi:2-polyprenyl-3-methyl-5-hydroxy-6-metoxy-1,4-benzoquinol methylase
MDDPSLPRADHLCALDALSTINFFSRTSSQLAAAVARLAAASGRSAKAGDRLKVVDVACGGGDVTVEVARRLARRGFSVDMLGIDKSSLAIARARRRAYSLARARVVFEQADVLACDTRPCDIAISSLFLHHLEDETVCGLLQSLASATRIGIVISDLVRSRTGLLFAIFGTCVLSRSHVARVDGPVSVRAARTPQEYRELLVRAGICNATVRGAWPSRVCIEWISGSE